MRTRLHDVLTAKNISKTITYYKKALVKFKVVVTNDGLILKINWNLAAAR